MAKILITTSSFNTNLPEIKALEAAGYEIILNPFKRKMEEKEVFDLLQDEQIEGLIAGLEPLTKNVLQNAKGLRVISRCGIGMDNVDIDTANNLGIQLFNTPDGPTDAVAELTIGLMLSVLREIPIQDQAIREKEWVRPMGSLLGSRTLGLIGCGRIGRRVADIAQGFGTKTIAYDPHLKTAPPGIALKPLDEVLQEADIISLHIPSTEANHHLINAEKIALMRKGAILINTARGGLVDEEALVQALDSNHLAGAGFDVFEKEPYKGPLTECGHTVLTAHTGSYAREAREKQEAQAAQLLLTGLQNELKAKRI